MKILAAVILCGLLGIGGTTELHVKSSMESKLSDGFAIQMMALLNLNYDSHQVPYLTVQLINPERDVFGTGVVVSRFVILVTGSPISKYENKPKCGGVEVKFNGELYSIANCESRFDIAVNLDEIHSKRLYNDIAIVVVNLGQFEPPIRLLENADLIVNGVPFGVNTQAFLIGYNAAGKQNMLRAEITNIGINCFKHRMSAIGAHRVFCARILIQGDLLTIDRGSPLFVRGVLVGIYSAKLQKYAREYEFIFSSYFGHFDWIPGKITHYDNNPPPPPSDCNVS